MKKKEKESKLFAITDYLIKKHNITEPVKLQKILYFLYLEYLKEKKKNFLKKSLKHEYMAQFWEMCTII